MEDTLSTGGIWAAGPGTCRCRSRCRRRAAGRCTRRTRGRSRSCCRTRRRCRRRTRWAPSRWPRSWCSCRSWRCRGTRWSAASRRTELRRRWSDLRREYCKIYPEFPWDLQNVWIRESWIMTTLELFKSCDNKLDTCLFPLAALLYSHWSTLIT